MSIIFSVFLNQTNVRPLQSFIFKIVAKPLATTQRCLKLDCVGWDNLCPDIERQVLLSDPKTKNFMSELLRGVSEQTHFTLASNPIKTFPGGGGGGGGGGGLTN